MPLLPSDDYERVRPLFDTLPEHLVIQALLDRSSPGEVYVNSLETPAASYMRSAEGSFLVGAVSDGGFIAELREMLAGTLFSQEDGALVLVVSPESCAPVLREMVPDRRMLVVQRRHYICRELRHDWRAALPDGFDVARIDHTFLERTDIEIPEHIESWIANNWTTREHFLERGFGFVTLHNESVVAWCLADCVTGARAEVGIRTAPAFRRRGLAAIVVAATVEHAFRSGYTEIGWHCNEDNIGSWKTAERVGFQHEGDYLLHYCLVNPLHQLGEEGWVDFQTGDYAGTAHAYDELFRLNPEAPDYNYHLMARAQAALGHHDAALDYLRKAIERGWTRLDETLACTEFRPLHGTAGWTALLGDTGGRPTPTGPLTAPSQTPSD